MRAYGFFALGVSWLAAALLGSTACGQTAEDVIENVLRNEQLYDDYDVRFATLATSNNVYGIDNVIVSGRQEFRTVVLRDKFYYEVNSSSVLGNGERKKRTLRAGYDGEWYRVNQNDDVGNISREPRVSGNLFRPHLVTLRPWVWVRLSTFLRGGEALRKDPAATNDLATSDQRLESVKLSKVGDFQTVECVVRNRSKSGETTDTSIIHLCVEKNYLPIYHRVFKGGDETVLLSDRRVEAFTSLGHLAFPKQVRWTNYAPDGKELATYKTVFMSVRRASALDKGIFSSIKFAPGRPLHRIENDRIKSTEVVPAEKKSDLRLVVAAACALFLVLVVLWRRYGGFRRSQGTLREGPRGRAERDAGDLNSAPGPVSSVRS